MTIKEDNVIYAQCNQERTQGHKGHHYSCNGYCGGGNNNKEIWKMNW